MFWLYGNRKLKTTMQHILVVDDEEDLREILRFNLESEGYGVSCAASAEDALAQFDATGGRFDLVLLDVMMERMSGFEMARRLREQGFGTPIVFLTARDTHSDELAGFGVGADDYITKPFSFDMVLARIRAVLRRSGQADRPAAGRAPTVNAPSSLTKRETLILELFEKHPGRYFSRQEILDAVWPDDALVCERTVDVHIARLRKKMGAEGSRIVNKTGFGYGLD